MTNFADLPPPHGSDRGAGARQRAAARLSGATGGATARHTGVGLLHRCGEFATFHTIVADVPSSQGYVALAIGGLGGLNACAPIRQRLAGAWRRLFIAAAGRDMVARQ